MSHHIIALDEIKRLINIEELLRAIEKGFELYSQNLAVIPPFGSLYFSDPPGDTHIKYGYFKNDSVYVVKIASGFYANAIKDLPVSQGLMLLFCSQTGALKSILLDEGYLTDLRTAIAGAIAAKYCAPANVQTIGIVGCGTQALMQLQMLRHVVSCRKAIVWGRNPERLKTFLSQDELADFSITATDDLKHLCTNSQLIVTCTPAKKALLQADLIQKGTHITAVGADGGGKQELDPVIFSKADRIVVDSRKQCFKHGDCAYALNEKRIEREAINEIGEVIMSPSLGRTSDEQITIADLTGIAAQDIQIAKYIYEKRDKQ